MERNGIACAGNWIVDHVKIIDSWPRPGNLANIISEERGTGGSPFNILMDMAAMTPDIPLDAVGLVGEDADGEWIRELVRPLARDVAGLRTTSAAPTSYTDVMTVQDTGQRTFFHMRGANETFDADHVDVDAIGARIFHLGYLLLLTAMDGPDPEFGTRAARLLARCRKAGIITSIDLVSAEVGNFAQIVTPALKYTDYCILNEVESGRVTGLELRDPAGAPAWDRIEAAARRLAELGAARNVTIHLPEGAVSLDVTAGAMHRSPSLDLPADHIKGTAGAGDAFCTGMLLGLHEAWPLPETLLVAHAAAAASMTHPTCTGGMTTLAEVRALADRLARR